MYKDKRVIAIIAAGGTGNRMGAPIPKQFLEINEKPILLLATEAFCNNNYVDSIYVVVGKEYVEITKDILANGLGPSQISKISGVVIGGKERQDSITNGLIAASQREQESCIILIHDGARPFIKDEHINAVIESAFDNGASVLGVPVKNTIKQKDEETGISTLQRDQLYEAQTPQGFVSEVLLDAYNKAIEDGFYGTDDASLVERLGHQVSVVVGDYSNIKITTVEDLNHIPKVAKPLAKNPFVEKEEKPLSFDELNIKMGELSPEELYDKQLDDLIKEGETEEEDELQFDDDEIEELERIIKDIGFEDSWEQEEAEEPKIQNTKVEYIYLTPRVGYGTDVHRFIEDRNLMLGGVKIPYEKGLDGHSDADVLTHAIMDSLLGAAGMGDIGLHFPPNDMLYKGISSLELLKKVKSLLDKNGFEIGNVDATVICQKPKVLPFRLEMQEKISRILGIGSDQVNIKGTTTEGLGPMGRGEGIAAEAVSVLFKKLDKEN